jgi:ABC-type multidrug transport system ATPase subunit
MRQKLGLALALGLGMPLTLLDEPFNGLDADAQATLRAGLVERAAAGGAIVLTGHQQELPAALGARVLALRGGRVVDAA